MILGRGYISLNSQVRETRRVVPGGVSKRTVYTFDQRGLVSRDTEHPFDLRALSGVEGSYLFDLRNIVSRESEYLFDQRSIVSLPSNYPFDLRALIEKGSTYIFDLGLVNVSRATAYPFDLRALCGVEASYPFDMRNVACRASGYPFDLRALIARQSAYPFDVRKPVVRESAYPFTLRALCGVEASYRFDMGYNVVGRETGCVFDLRALCGVEVSYPFSLRAFLTAAPLYVFSIVREPKRRLKRLMLLDPLNLRTTAVYRAPRDISVLPIVYGDLLGGRIPTTPLDKDGYVHHVSDMPMQLIGEVYVDGEPKGFGFKAMGAYQDETGRSIAAVVFDEPQYDKRVSVAGKGAIKLSTGELIETPADLIRSVLLDVQGYDETSIDPGAFSRFQADCLREEINVAHILEDQTTVKEFLDQLALNIHSHWMISDGKSVMRLRWV